MDLQNNRDIHLEEAAPQKPNKEMESSQETVVSDLELSMEEDMDAEQMDADPSEDDEPTVEIMVVDSPEPINNIFHGPSFAEDAYLSNYEGNLHW